MSNAERDELFQLILGRTTTKAVERILAAGYRKPRQVTTATIEDADAFSDGTVILDREGEAWQKSGHMWYLAAGGYIDKGPADFLPATVLWEPEATK
ncbi:hypothetical protein ACFFGR_09350 [Arthrobacter liuii]|uniref:Uncharacterized protein n=1 Tax=Arthrobacter liuii TaxID=1476996 RepID=A0ABQ2AQI8_9MICC|nr:hypothetical protein [Arthrobacter liuii]GGH93856.1 hypothetical protein GCM10007170_15700 [Arthrobacter liuii]